ncbi:MAG: hypothetical protein ABR520_11205 [Mycobacteriales bacterium]|nr:hypothetical protein [Actinomycetota bacterium]
MTWQIKVRTAPGALVAAEYECPVHGRFAVDVPRGENGDPPAEWPCAAPMYPGPGASVDYAFALAMPMRREDYGTCGTPSPHVISAPARCKVRLVEAVRGRDQKPEHKTWTDMTNLMEGQPVDEWREDRERKVWDEERHKAVKEILNG